MTINKKLVFSLSQNRSDSPAVTSWPECMHYTFGLLTRRLQVPVEPSYIPQFPYLENAVMTVCLPLPLSTAAISVGI